MTISLQLGWVHLQNALAHTQDRLKKVGCGE